MNSKDEQSNQSNAERRRIYDSPAPKQRPVWPAGQDAAADKKALDPGAQPAEESAKKVLEDKGLSDATPPPELGDNLNA